MLKRFFKYLRRRNHWNRSWKIRDYRQTALAVKLVTTGALVPCSKGVSSIIPLRRES
jgi:hypothetical protein